MLTNLCGKSLFLIEEERINNKKIISSSLYYMVYSRISSFLFGYKQKPRELERTKSIQEEQLREAFR